MLRRFLRPPRPSGDVLPHPLGTPVDDRSLPARSCGKAQHPKCNASSGSDIAKYHSKIPEGMRADACRCVQMRADACGVGKTAGNSGSLLSILRAGRLRRVALGRCPHLSRGPPRSPDLVSGFKLPALEICLETKPMPVCNSRSRKGGASTKCAFFWRSKSLRLRALAAQNSTARPSSVAGTGPDASRQLCAAHSRLKHKELCMQQRSLALHAGL